MALAAEFNELASLQLLGVFQDGKVDAPNAPFGGSGGASEDGYWDRRLLPAGEVLTRLTRADELALSERKALLAAFK